MRWHDSLNPSGRIGNALKCHRLWVIAYFFVVIPIQLSIIGISIWMTAAWFSLLRVVHAWGTDPGLAASLVAVLNATITTVRNQDPGFTDDGWRNAFIYASSEIQEIGRLGTEPFANAVLPKMKIVAIFVS